MSQKVKLQRGADIGFVPEEEVPLGFVVCCAAAVVFFALGVWKVCEIVVWAAKVMHGGAG